MNCKLKATQPRIFIRLWGPAMGAVTVLKFLQTLALDFPYIRRQLEMQYRKF